MKLHIQLIEYKLQKIIENCNFVSKDHKTNFTKNEKDFDEEDQKLMTLNVEL